MVGAFLGREPIQQVADAPLGRFGGPLGGVAQQQLELGEDLFDQVEVRAAGRKEQQVGACLPDRPPDGHSLVAGEIVYHDHVLRCQRRHKEAFDIDAKRIAVDRSVEDERGVDPADPQGGNERYGALMSVWCISSQAFTSRDQPRKGTMLVFAQISSMKTSRFGLVRF